MQLRGATAVTKDRRPRALTRVLLNSAMLAFALFTLAWGIWGLTTPGDYFANGSDLVLPTLGGALLVGFVTGVYISGRLRIVVTVAAIMSLCFWIFVPDGWWAH